MTAQFDPRLNPFRDDLAAAHLEGQVEARKFVTGTRRQVIEPSAPILRRPRFNAALDTEALFGETVVVYDDHEGWSWVQLETDKYVGYLPTSALGDEVAEATHRVSVPRTMLFPEPDIKSGPVQFISLNTPLSATSERDGFLELAQYRGFVFKRHVTPWNEFQSDFVSVAETFLGTPYLWGGRQSLGLDCSGLVQMSLAATGYAAQRDSYMQEQSLGTALDCLDTTALRRGDLVFWPGHVAIVFDGDRFIHANGHHMQVVIEPIAETVDRIASIGKHVTMVRRP